MFTLSRLEWIVLAAAVFLCPGLSWGADPQPARGESTEPARGESIFDRLDKNKDGHLSKQELAAPEAQNGNWIAIDRNRDGRISREEFNTRLAQPATKAAPNAAAGGTRAPKPETGKQE